MKKTYYTKGTCASQIDIDIEDGIIRSAEFHGGCDGNLQGISHLVVGMDAARAKELLSGIRCGRKSTSCPDQLAKAIEMALGQ
ncbi:uncharacterized protein TIGR03905 [Sporobacter termitidis DSM 10068]|uniref:ribonucleoside-diphosphate reductase n=1 Tax=Sporobacter termitidis DSM 10068 TaxID=1123282 RepID=A0A1M5Y5F2_9FIRM|nr:TIGR03905 family TSCPD domain-containing protein [Sporobacter termitidis]SHI07321.1 uncharacterized protein TIGR03905 [Sporobacter termitidis DSM 10068]